MIIYNTNKLSSLSLINSNINSYYSIYQVDSDAQAFITATGITDTTQKNAINQLVLDLKSYSIWTKMSAIYPFVGGTATTHKWNLKDPRDLDVAFRLTFSGGWTHSATGALPNGTNGYADTFLTPSTSLLQNSSHISYYSRTQSNGLEVEIGSSTGPNPGDAASLLEIRTSGTTYYRVNSQGSYITYSDADSRAFYIGNRTGVSVVNGWRNSTKVATTAYVKTAVSNLVDGAPEALDTLHELATALEDDAAFSTTVTNSIGTKLAQASNGPDEGNTPDWLTFTAFTAISKSSTLF